MATNNNRDVRLGIEVETTGEESIKRLSDALREVGVATETQRRAEAAARAEVATDKAALAARRDDLSKLKINSDAATRATADYQQAEKALKLAIIEAGAALREKQSALTATVTATRAAAATESSLKAELATVAAAHRQAGAAAAAGATQQVRAAESVRDSLGGIAGQLRSLQTAVAAVVGGQLLGGLIGDVGRASDAYANLSARIKLVTGDGAAFDHAFRSVAEIAQRTNASLEGTGELFTRIAAAGKEIGVSNAEALRLTETINQAVTLSGASAESSSAAITQLVQGLQSGVLAGDEFRSVMEQSPRLARALADGLGVTTGELRKLAEAQQLTSTSVIHALQGQSAALQAEFQTLPLTIGRSIQSLSTAWTLYVGEASKASGASATVAKAIDAVAKNLDGLAKLLFAAGKAAVAYQAVKLAATFLDIGTAARASAAAVAVQTVAVEANTVASRAAAVAGAEAAAGAGRFAAALSAVKLFSLVAVLTNLRSIGTAIGEGVARWVGYGKAIDDLEASERREAEAARASAQAKAEQAQKAQLAADAALGLNDQSRALVGTFTEVVKKGGEVSEALGKVSAALKLGDLSGVANAVAALDALAVRGKLTGDQIREALAGALKSEDLNVFRINALAAFDQTEQGARRLKLALDAIADESLRRAGTSLQELATGFSDTATRAITDLDNLAQTLRDLKVTGDDAGRALSTSLDKALAAASTERAVQAVIDRLGDLGKQGLLTGEQLAAAMDRARAKIDDLKPGINSLAEAMKSFGLKTREELQSVADKLKASYDQIANSTRVSLSDKVKAFGQYRDAAIAANGGVESSEIRVQAEMLRMKGAAIDTGNAIATSMHASGQAVDALGAQINAAAGSLSSLTDAALKARNAADLSILGSNQYDKDGFALDSTGNRLTIGGQTNAPAGSVFDQAAFLRAQQAATRSGLPGPNPANFYGPAQSARSEAPRAGGAPAAAAAPAPTAGSTHYVNININGASTAVNTASAADAATLSALLSQLGDASSRAAVGR